LNHGWANSIWYCFKPHWQVNMFSILYLLFLSIKNYQTCLVWSFLCISILNSILKILFSQVGFCSLSWIWTDLWCNGWIGEAEEHSWIR
jgi:hypothetical protein